MESPSYLNDEIVGTPFYIEDNQPKSYNETTYIVTGMQYNQRTQTEVEFGKLFSTLESAKQYYEEANKEYPNYQIIIVKHEKILANH